MDTKRLEVVHAAMRARRGRRCMVVVPSRAIERWHEPPAETQAYEERLLCLLLMLRDPGLTLVYVTVLAGRAGHRRVLPLAAPAGGAQRRPRPADAALRERSVGAPADREAARATEPAGPDPVVRPAGALGFLLPYMTTELERDLALALDMPLYGADPRHLDHGTKSGSRELFARAGVPHPLGAGARHRRPRGDRGDRAAARREARSSSRRWSSWTTGSPARATPSSISAGCPPPAETGSYSASPSGSQGMALEAPGVSVDAYLPSLAARGGVVEERLTGPDVRSPSVQLEVTPAGDVEIVSTHDQILAGQSYLGCRFPAAPPYAATITGLAREVGRQLAGAGVIGRSAVDFVVLRDAGGGWNPYAVEINLRSGGTTHPFAALALLTGGGYDARRGDVHDGGGRREALRGDRRPRGPVAAGPRPRWTARASASAAGWASTTPGNAASCSTC